VFFFNIQIFFLYSKSKSTTCIAWTDPPLDMCDDSHTDFCQKKIYIKKMPITTKQNKNEGSTFFS